MAACEQAAAGKGAIEDLSIELEELVVQGEDAVHLGNFKYLHDQAITDGLDLVDSAVRMRYCSMENFGQNCLWAEGGCVVRASRVAKVGERWDLWPWHLVALSDSQYCCQEMCSDLVD